MSTRPPASPTSAQRREAAVERLLSGLEAIVARHRALVVADYDSLHAELIAAEVAFELSLARSALQRSRAVSRPEPAAAQPVRRIGPQAG